MARYYLAGSGGMLGEAFFRELSPHHVIRCTDKQISSPFVDFLDFRDYDEYRRQVLDFRPEVLFHLGAHTDLEYCERHQEDAYMTNTIAVEYATAIANEIDVPLVYISTAGIFDGKKDWYDDWDTPNPLSVYGRSKYLGERFVVENAQRYFVCRAGWMMGGGKQKDKKFVNKLIAQLDSGASELFVVSDKNGTPTYTHDFANTVMGLIGRSAYGLYNTVCGGLTSRVEVSRYLLELLGRYDVKVNAVDSSYFAAEYFAVRPASERLVTRRLDILRLNGMRDWRHALADYLSTYYGIDPERRGA